jgi:hypothetical protein
LFPRREVASLHLSDQFPMTPRVVLLSPLTANSLSLSNYFSEMQSRQLDRD